jgi:hypothetical protein
MIAQGINKITVFKVQTALGAPASGTGGQVMRREQSKFDLTKDTYENNEIASHQQSTGITHGLRKVSGSLNGVLSPNTYAAITASLLRKAFAATTPYVAGTDVVSAATAPHFVDTSGGWLTAGLKIGDVVRFTGFTTTATGNNDKNFLITALTATNMTGVFLNGDAVIAKTESGSVTATVTGKKAIVPTTSQTQEYWTVEEWYSDITRSELFTDVVPSSIDIGLPATGNATFAANFAGLDKTIGASQILTTPTAATTTPILTAVNGAVLVNGTSVGNITGASIKVDSGAAPMGAVIGADVSPDIQRGRVKVSGQITAYFQDGVLSGYFDDATNIGLVIVAADSDLAAADFVSFSMSKVKLSSDAKDDGEKGIIGSYSFTAELNGSGGAALANDQTILTVQDSQAA